MLLGLLSQPAAAPSTGAYSAFQSNAFQSNAFQIIAGGEVVTDNGYLGGTFNDPYEYDRKGREQRSQLEAMRESQEEIIRLKLEAQALRQQELSTLEAKDKQTQRQLLATQAKQKELALLVAEQIALLESLEKSRIKKNAEALLVLSMACPWLNLGGAMQ